MMQKIFPTTLAAGWLFCAAGLALAGDGVCDSAEAQAGLCFVSPTGFVVEALSGPGGEFPVIDADGNSVFAYRITGPGANGGSCQAVHAISHASLLVPALCGGIAPTLVGAWPAAEYKTSGQGDPSCAFGTGNLEANVLKWDTGVGCNGTSVYTLVLEGAYSAAPTPFSLKAGPHCSVGTILGPACTSVVRLCPPNPNSTGQSGTLTPAGSFSISENAFYLYGTGLPPSEPGFYFFGTQETDVPFGNGRRCVGGNVSRALKIPISIHGESATWMDLTRPPLDTLVAGIPYYFQLYYRDSQAGGEQFNTTDALCIVFTP